jgi:hypothetical protein
VGFWYYGGFFIVGIPKVLLSGRYEGKEELVGVTI